MEATRQIIEKASVPLVVNIPDEYKDRKVEVIVMTLDEKESALENKLTPEDFFGKMKWEGDALAEQKKLRDEWD